MLTSEVILKIFISAFRKREVYGVIIKSFWYIIAACVVAKIVEYIFNFFGRKPKEERTTTLSVFLSIKNPLLMYVWVVCYYDIVEIINLHEVTFWKNLEVILTAFAIFWLFYGVITEFSRKITDKKELQGGVVDYGGVVFVEKIIQFVVFFIIALFAMSQLGLNLQSLLTIGGIGGLTIGLASKDIIANIFGTALLFIDKPFTVGEWISSPDKPIEGIVQEIGWRRTTIMSFGKYPIYVSNSLFTNMVVENKGRMICRRIEEMIPIRFVDLDKLDKITNEVRNMLFEDKNVSKKGITLVFFESVARPSALNLKLLAYTTSVDLPGHSKIRQGILIKTMNIIRDNGGQLAYNVSHVTVDSTVDQADSTIVSGDDILM